MANVAPSSEITNLPSERAKDRCGELSKVLNLHSKATSELSSESSTFNSRTVSESDGPFDSSQNLSDTVAPAAFHANSCAKASDRPELCVGEVMLFDLIRGYGFEEGFKTFCEGFPHDIPTVQGLPGKLRMIADQLEAAYIRGWG